MKNKKNFYYYIIIFLLFSLWRVISPFEKSLTISFGQYVLAIFLIVFFIKNQILREIFSKKFLFLTSVILCIFFIKEYIFTSFNKNKVVFARLSNDSLEIKTSSFRTWLNKRLLDDNLKVERLPFNITTRREARKWLKKNSDKEILIWGNQNYLKLSFHKKENIRIDKLSKDYKRYQFVIFDDIQTLKIPYEPKKATVTFISNVLYKLNQDEFKLRQTQYQKFLWRNNSHRAYPLFLVGNYKLIEFLRTGEEGLLKCAISHYENSLKFLRKQDNLELYAKLNNNLMVAFYLRYLNTANVKYKRKSIKVFNRIFPFYKKVSANLKKNIFENYLKFKGIDFNLIQNKKNF